MAHFAKLDANNVVEQVIVVSNDDIKDNTGTEVESIGISFCQKLFGGSTTWKQTSYNGNMRGNYAGIGYTYMTNVATLGVGSTDVFIPHQPFPSWSVGVNTAQWFAPIAEPTLTLPVNVDTPITFKVDVLTSDVAAMPVKFEPSP